MSSPTESKPCKFATHHHDAITFQSSAVQKYVAAAGPVADRCNCSACRKYLTAYRAQESVYQQLHSHGLGEPCPPPSPPSDETVFTKIEDKLTDPSLSTEGETADAETEEEDIPFFSLIFNSIVIIRLTKMAPASNEEQFKFLISCIRYSNNGKVDFTEVAKECNIVSKGAAAKRYERMMKANGIHQSQSGGTTASSSRDTPAPSPRRKASPSAGPSSSKKRKLDSFAETTSNLNTDDDEGLSNVKAESNTTIKAEAVKAEPVKEEHTDQEGPSDSTASTGASEYPFNDALGFDGADDMALMDDFVAFGGSSRPGHGQEAAFHGGLSEEGFASMDMTQATENEDGQKLHESILITD